MDECMEPDRRQPVQRHSDSHADARSYTHANAGTHTDAGAYSYARTDACANADSRAYAYADFVVMPARRPDFQRKRRELLQGL